MVHNVMEFCVLLLLTPTLDAKGALSQCYGYTQDLYEMEYIKPFYIVRKIGSMDYSHDNITKLAFVLRMMWAFKRRVVSANQVWNNLKSQYEADDDSESSDDGDNYTKQTPKKRTGRTK